MTIYSASVIHNFEKNIFHFKEGDVEYWENINGLVHREDGPAYINCAHNIYIYFRHGQRHRVDGPAWINPFYETWWIDGYRHREDDPAYIQYDENKKILLASYWYKGNKIKCNSTEEFIKLIKLKAFW